MATQADPSSHDPTPENHKRLSTLLRRFLGRNNAPLTPEGVTEASQALPPETTGGDESNVSRPSARRVVPGLPRAKTFKRQQSELRERLELNKPTQAERRAVSVDRRGTHLPRDVSASRSQRLPRASAPDFFDDAGSTTTAGNDQSALHSPMEEKQFLNVPDTGIVHVDLAAQKESSAARFPSREPSAADARSVTTSAYDTQIRDELESKWILNLSMHFRDKSRREKFFVTYREKECLWRRVTISLDYRDAPSDSLEGDLQDTKFQREKSAKIYEAIRESLQDIQFYDTVTNLKLQTTNGRLHVHVVEDVNEIIHFPAVQMVQHLGCRRIREKDIIFDSHMSGFVYKVQVDGRTLIKKEIPGPDTIEEFLYEVNALNSLRFSASTVSFYGVVVDDGDTSVKGLLIDYAEKGALIDIIYDAQEHGPDLPWIMREKWARQIVQGLSDIHEAGFVQGDFTLSNIVIDDDDNAKIIDINRRGCPVGWEPPEATPLINNNQRISMYIGVKSDLYQLGMVLWALAMLEDEPEAHRRPLRLDPDIEVPRWYRRLVDNCLSDNPRMRKQATVLLDMFPSSSYENHDQHEPPSISVDDGLSIQQYRVEEHERSGHPIIRTVTPQSDAYASGIGHQSGLTSPGLSEDAFYYPPRGRSPPSPMPSNLDDCDAPFLGRNGTWSDRRNLVEPEESEDAISRVDSKTRMSEITRQLEGSLRTIGSQSCRVSAGEHGGAGEETQSIDLEEPCVPLSSPQIVVDEAGDEDAHEFGPEPVVPRDNVPDKETTNMDPTAVLTLPLEDAKSTDPRGGSQTMNLAPTGVQRQSEQVGYIKERETPLLHQEHDQQDDNYAANYAHVGGSAFPPNIPSEPSTSLQFPASDRPVYDAAADLTGIGTGYETEEFRKSICSDEDLGLTSTTPAPDVTSQA
ncbi:hypothetical protein PFICI_05199 [Pestalotiopsis fici W106-1]|uniref:Protein kinase domain-containing protein n=1 Tax=Pestalotiopsis fici (strain W106-1 / CGMCC3.15140) TaxID=1229662 RepID=W3XB63_PESFW|nr:uncharacterized protein PFICI_05199 [Pestalotiopsis fici W106-1]ETS83323.1 hypothetical protein PFICI_05199 [Pestalotiopsis fici W106-1]